LTTALQSFALVTHGPTLTPQPGCEAPAGAAALPCANNGRPRASGDVANSANVDNSNGVQSDDGFASSAWTCACEPPWLGPLCDRQAKELTFQTTTGTSILRSTLLPWQWDFFHAETCGTGSYELVLEEEIDEEGDALGSIGNGGIIISASVVLAGNHSQWSTILSERKPHMPTSSGQLLTWPPWEEDGVKFSVTTSKRGTASALGNSRKVRRSMLTAEFTALAEDTGAKHIRIALFQRSRSSPRLSFALQWRLQEPCAVFNAEAGSALRGGNGNRIKEVEHDLTLWPFLLAGFSICVAICSCLMGWRACRDMRKCRVVGADSEEKSNGRDSKCMQ